jgi:hypothetical protein
MPTIAATGEAGRTSFVTFLFEQNFEKIPHCMDEPGKGMEWQIAPEYREDFIKKSILPSTKKLRRRLDTPDPNSPAGLVDGPKVQAYESEDI